MKQHANPPPAEHPSVLLIGPDDSRRSILRSILQQAGFRTFICARCRDAADLIPFASVVVCECSLPDGTWKDVLWTARARNRAPAFVVTSREAAGDLWADVINLGGSDVLAQPFRAEEVLWVVQGAHRRWRILGDNGSARPPGRPQSRMPAAHGVR
jgi:DNA-binding response OmpR family regulator